MVDTFLSVVMVCTGNICRSPMAEGILRDRWLKRGHDDLIVTSMGIHGLDNNPPTEAARRVCEEHGIDISSHRSRPLIGDELSDADLILTMDVVQREYVQLFFPIARDRVFLLGAWPGPENRKNIIKDPIGGSLRVYRKTFEIIEGHINRILEPLETLRKP
ncbi:MAG: low molecular weight protein arginine phosphatase [Chitinivibrionales bacterium]|nr:low molecular weight protein arginine phosphatase [Chitinivibrionales bacterium]MBD3357537.1 low molecular weight protein arginine phosphatase [Chitinivibrionales bacterium]